MKIIKEKPIQESQMDSKRKENLEYAAQLLCEAFYGAAQNVDEAQAKDDSELVARIFVRGIINFVGKEPMWIERRTKMDPKEKNIRVNHFIDTLIKALK